MTNKISDFQHEVDTLTFTTDNKVVLQLTVLRDSVIRFRYGTRGILAEDFSYAIDEDDRYVGYNQLDITEDNKNYIITTNKLVVKVAKTDLKVRIFDKEGNLWTHEMGPKHGDELNIIERGRNYGYPMVSQGDHYSGVKIPNHEDYPVFKGPEKAWVPAISPAGFIIYKGDKFSNWTGNGFIGGLSSKALVRVTFSKSDEDSWQAEEAERYEWGKRVREVEQDSMGNIYVLEDKGGRLIKLERNN